MYQLLYHAHNGNLIAVCSSVFLLPLWKYLRLLLENDAAVLVPAHAHTQLDFNPFTLTFAKRVFENTLKLLARVELSSFDPFIVISNTKSFAFVCFECFLQV